MTEAQLVGRAAEGAPQELMPEADAERGYAGFGQAFDLCDYFRHRRRIAGAVREKDAVGLEREHVRGGRRGGHDCETTAVRREPAQRVELHAEVVADDVEALRARGRHLVRLFRRGYPRQ